MLPRTYRMSKTFDFQPPKRGPGKTVMDLFRICPERIRSTRLTHSIDFEMAPGSICFITGPSGAGKSVVLHQLYSRLRPLGCIGLDAIALAPEKRLIETFCCSAPDALEALSLAGLADPFCALQKVKALSEGQRYRARLAHLLGHPGRAVFADEFCSTLDRISALSVAYQIRKLADRSDRMFFLASSHDDLIAELRPEVLILKYETGPAKVIYRPRGCVKL